jgi:hypothetical protein
VLAAVVVISMLAAGAVTAVATDTGFGHSTGTAQSAGSAAGNVKVKLNVSKFVKVGKRLVAKGTAVATYTSPDGTPTVVTAPFSARVLHGTRRTLSSSSAHAPSACPVLTLELDTLSLDLLGLHVDLSKVVLTTTADSSGGALGKLFCNLSSGQLAAASPTTTRTLSKVAQHSGFSTKGTSFGVPTRQMQSIGPGPCSIVDLLLGPLHLELLGLIVDLNQIHLQITADPNGGLLGSALCSIAPPPTTTSATT